MIATIDLIVKFIILSLLTAQAEIFLRHKSYSFSVLFSAVWLVVFRLTLLRAMSMYVGVFSYQTPELLGNVLYVLQSVETSLLLDSVLLMGSLATYKKMQKFLS